MARRRTALFALAFTALIVVVASACGGAADEDLSSDGGEGLPSSSVAAPVDSDSASAENAPADAEAAPQVATEVEALGGDQREQVVASARKGNEKLAPRLIGNDSWINSEPLTLEGQRGKVVVIDFWTYTCINCIRTFPYLRDWHAKYADKGLVIIGVHTPEFEFEKKRENVIAAAEEYGLLYPIAQDNNFDTWHAYENRFWPAKYLIDKDGYIRYTHFGEGAYDETEKQIQDLLTEAGFAVSNIAIGSKPAPVIDPKATTSGPQEGLTRELYAGFERNIGALIANSPPYIVQEEYYQSQNSVTLYQDPGDHRNHFMYIHGLWLNDNEKLVHARETQDYEDYVLINFFAREVNLVMRPDNGIPFEVRLTIDGVPLPVEQAGADVRWDSDGNSYVSVDGPRIYNLVMLTQFGGHKLKMSSNSTDFALFAFTFGAYQDDNDR